MIELYYKNGGERFDVINMSLDPNDDRIIRVITTSTNRTFHLMEGGMIEEKLPIGVILINIPHTILYIIFRIKTYLDFATVELQMNKFHVDKLFPNIKI